MHTPVTTASDSRSSSIAVSAIQHGGPWVEVFHPRQQVRKSLRKNTFCNEDRQQHGRGENPLKTGLRTIGGEFLPVSAFSGSTWTKTTTFDFSPSIPVAMWAGMLWPAFPPRWTTSKKRSSRVTMVALRLTAIPARTTPRPRTRLLLMAEAGGRTTWFTTKSTGRERYEAADGLLLLQLLLSLLPPPPPDVVVVFEFDAIVCDSRDK